MTILPTLAPLHSLQGGLRALARVSERSAACHSILTRVTATRALSLAHRVGSCSVPGTPRITRAPRDRLSPSPRSIVGRTATTVVFRFRPVTHYIHLPEDYEDALGLPFRKEDLNQEEVNDALGPAIKAADANKLLKIIHGRRVAGTLDDPDLQQNTARFRAEHKIKALEYLRRHIPVDEVINAGLRAEDELRVLEEQDQAKANSEKDAGKGSAQAPEPDVGSEAVAEVKPPTGRLPSKKKSDDPYGESTFDRIRARNRALREAEEARLEEERKRTEEAEALKHSGPLAKPEVQPTALSKWRQMHEERAMDALTEPPKMKAWERLLPMAAMTVLILGACALFAIVHKPPRREWRMWPDVPPAAATCIALLLVHVSVLALWKFPPLFRFFVRHMRLDAATPRPFQLIGAILSHQSLAHLMPNAAILCFIGVRLHDEIGRGNFLAIYFASGALGFMTSLAALVLFVPHGLYFTSAGASGAIYGIMAAYFWLYRFDEFKILSLPPDPWSGPQGLVFLAITAGANVAGLWSRKRRTFDYPSHLGGMLGGILGMELVKRRMDAQARLRAERMKAMAMRAAGHAA